MNNIDDDLRQSLLKGCKYFPKLFPALLKIVQSPTLFIKTLLDKQTELKFKSIMRLLTILNSYIEENFPLVNSFDYFEENISNKELINKDYYKFKNGYLYEKNFNSLGFVISLEGEAKRLLDDYEYLESNQNTGISTLEFSRFTHALINKLYKNYDPENPLCTSREYAEFLFLEKVKEECANLDLVQNFKKNNEI